MSAIALPAARLALRPFNPTSRKARLAFQIIASLAPRDEMARDSERSYFEAIDRRLAGMDDERDMRAYLLGRIAQWEEMLSRRLLEEPAVDPARMRRLLRERLARVEELIEIRERANAAMRAPSALGGFGEVAAILGESRS